MTGIKEGLNCYLLLLPFFFPVITLIWTQKPFLPYLSEWNHVKGADKYVTKEHSTTQIWETIGPLGWVQIVKFDRNVEQIGGLIVDIASEIIAGVWLYFVIAWHLSCLYLGKKRIPLRTIWELWFFNIINLPRS